MDSVVMVQWQATFNFQFFLKISLELGVDVVDYCFETIFLVNLVTVAHSVNNGQLENFTKRIQFSIICSSKTHEDTVITHLHLNIAFL